MEKRSPIRNWKFLQADDRLRGFIQQRIGSYGNEIGELADKIPCKKSEISAYLRNVKPNLNDFELIKLADLVGLEVTLKITLNDVSSLSPEA